MASRNLRHFYPLATFFWHCRNKTLAFEGGERMLKGLSRSGMHYSFTPRSGTSPIRQPNSQNAFQLHQPIGGKVQRRRHMSHFYTFTTFVLGQK